MATWLPHALELGMLLPSKLMHREDSTSQSRVYYSDSERTIQKWRQFLTDNGQPNPMSHAVDKMAMISLLTISLIGEGSARKNVGK
jgi:hypothetical protein